MNLSIDDVDAKIVEIRNTKVLLDCDVALLYGIETKRVNEAVKNNPDKFPEGYILTVNEKEKAEVVENFDHLSPLIFSHAPLKAFTEKGLYMLATILKSSKATETTLKIIETFAKIRELTRTVKALSIKTDKEGKRSLMQRSGEIISDILGDSLSVSETETTFEINLAVMNLKHTVKKAKKKESE